MRLTRHSAPTRTGRLGRPGRVGRVGRPRRLARSLGVLVGTITASLAVAAPTAGAVVNGTPSGPAPWAVQITVFDRVPGAPCTGVVVHPRWVATAAHCGPTDPGAYTLGFGNWATVPGGFGSTAPLATPGIVGAFGSLDTGSLGRHTPAAVHKAPAGDFMLLKLRHPAPTPAVRRAGVDPAPGDILRFHGFGETEPLAMRSPVLRTGLTRLDRIEARPGSRVGHNHTIRGGFSPGDSGGPVFRGDRLVGIHTISDRARRQPDGTIPARYESIPAQNGWIDWMIANR